LFAAVDPLAFVRAGILFFTCFRLHRYTHVDSLIFSNNGANAEVNTSERRFHPFILLPLLFDCARRGTLR
jgi:hypothetical protein